MAKQGLPPAADGFKHPSKKGVIISHAVQIVLSLTGTALSCVNIYWTGAGQNGYYFAYYASAYYCKTIVAFSSGSITIYASLATLLLCSQMRPIWLFLIIFNTLIMTFGVSAVTALLFSDYESFLSYTWYGEMVASGICVLLSIPSTIRAAKLKRHYRRALNMLADEERDEVCRKSVALEDEPRPATSSLRSRRTHDESRTGYTNNVGPSRPISTAETMAHWSNGTGSVTLDRASDEGSETHSLPPYGSRLSKDTGDEIQPVI